ncbi:MAG TPA: (2Fe-2S)-binding protein [Vulgatibacteraceae bacterium]|nr:(2Fe-2S)-binding protein [Vulgatibacteraceae bacterium]
MYVCICNAVTEDDVYGCLANGCRTAKEVKAACGFKPGCGMCTRRLHTMVSEYRTADELADALTGGPLPLAAVPERTGAPLADRPSVDQPVVGQPVVGRPVDPVGMPVNPPIDPDAEGGTAPKTAA